MAAIFSLTLVGVALAGAGQSGPTQVPALQHSSPATSGSAAPKPAGSGSASPAPSRTHARHHHATAQAAVAPLRTSCRSVAHIGDSTSAGLVSPLVLTDPALRLAARYADVGVRHLRVDASGGRSIVEILPGQVNGYHVARAWASHGFRGCWVFALGTNDTANVSVGSDVSRLARVERMMSAAHGQRVLWVNTRTMLSGGPWAEANMRRWNDTLLSACARYPNLRIFNWAAVANPGWYLTDGIHYTSAGYAARARAIADALARAFGRDGASRGCVVR